MESARLIAHLARVTRDIDLAEELAQDALLAALEQWPTSGVPDRPAAWLMTAAKHRAVNYFRRNRLLERKHEELGVLLAASSEERRAAADPDSALDDELGDDLLRLIFIACHPLLSPEARVALTLRLLGGLSTPEIARAFLLPEPTIAQRIVRAKRTLAEAGVPFELPARAERAAHLSSVLAVIYLIFNEGYAASAGDDYVRPPLCEEALRLGRILASLMPDEAEVHGLCALMELHSSRLRARVGAGGEPILLLDQNRSLWDPILIRRGFAALGRVAQLGGGRGAYALQAAISACHAHALSAEQTDWHRIVALYDVLREVMPSPVVELNRAVAVAMAEGAAAGLALLDGLRSEARLKDYAPLPSARGDLLVRLRRFDEARDEFERAAGLSQNGRDRALLLARAASCARQSGGG